MHQKEKKNNDTKHNISNILNNVGSIFTGTYLLYKDVPKETMSERSIPKRTKLKSQRFNEIERKKQNGNKELFKIHFTDY